MTGRRKKPTTSGDAQRPDLRERQTEFFEEFFRQGAELTRQLLEENAELRGRIAELEERARRAESDERSDFVAQYQRIERDHHDLACLFVSQSQLGKTRDAAETIGVITEVLLNFVGADLFAIYVADADGTPQPLYAYGADRGALHGRPAETVVAAVRDGTTSLGTIERREVTSEPVAVFPLSAADGPYGAVAIWSFLNQKIELAAVDRRLVEVIANAGGAALDAARLRSAGPRRSRPDRFRTLALLLGIV